MSDPIPSQCAGIANEITAIEQEKALFQELLKEATPSMKPLLIREIRKIGLELAHKRQELNVCLSHNPPSRPAGSQGDEFEDQKGSCQAGTQGCSSH
jgi:hypothetical protein